MSGSGSSSDSSSSSQPSRSRRWQCFLGCGQRYMKSSGRSIRRHVLLCYRRRFASECKGVSDAQIHDLLVSQEEKGVIRTGLKRWRLRRSRRLAMDLPAHERWDCPKQCGRYFRSTSSRSIAKHKHACSFEPYTDDNVVHAQPSIDTAASASAAAPDIRTSAFPSIMSPTISTSSTSSPSTLSSFPSSSSSSSSPPLTSPSRQPSCGASADAADAPSAIGHILLSAPCVALANLPQPHSGPTVPLGQLTATTSVGAASHSNGSSVLRPIPRLCASVPLVPPLSPFRTVGLASVRGVLPPLSGTKFDPTASGISLSTLTLHSPSSAFRPLNCTTATTIAAATTADATTAADAAAASNTFFSSSSSSLPSLPPFTSVPSLPSLPPNLFSLSPFHALSYPLHQTLPLHHGYVLCSFPAQQVQVPLISWPC